MENYLCTIQNINNFYDNGFSTECAYVQAACSNKEAIIDFFSFYYCNINQNIPIMSIISFLCVMLCFNFCSVLADYYISPSLEVISKKLKLSAAVAGCTILAIGNGAPDLMSAFVAGKKSSEGVAIATGALLGGCLFNITVVISFCIIGAKKIKIEKNDMIRDSASILFAVGYFIIIGSIGIITIYWTLGFFCLYLFYIAYQAIFKKMTEERENDIQDMIKESLSFMVSDLFSNKCTSKFSNLKMTDFPMVKKTKSDDQNQTNQNLILVDDFNSPMIEESQFFLKFRIFYKKAFTFIINLTLPGFEEDHWNLYLTSLTPIFGSGLIFWRFQFIQYYDSSPELFFIIFGSISVAIILISILIFTFGRRTNLAEKYSGIFAGISFVGALLWMEIIVTVFIDWLSYVTVISEISPSFLSLTMLAWGNSLGDLFMGYSLSKNGLGEMAVIGTYSGQIFGLLFGFGVTLIQQLFQGAVNLDLYNFDNGKSDNLLTLALILFIIVSVAISLVLIKINKWYLENALQKIVLSGYSIFLVVAACIEFLT